LQIDFAEEPGLSAVEYLDLFSRAVMPADDSRDAAQAALARTINLTARVRGKLVGCARILTDGHFCGLLADVVVIPEYRAQGLWRALFDRAWARAPAKLWVIPEYGHEEEQEGALREHKFGITPNKPWIGFKGRRLRVHDPDWAWQIKDQEPWDYDRFLEIYNGIAKERGGWVFEADGRTPDVLRERYHSYPEHYTSLYEFAYGLFYSDQRMD
jgi:GNAT superfamily N-acetyltransferase